MKKFALFLFGLLAAFSMGQVPPPGLSRSQADQRYGAPSTSAALGAKFALNTKGTADVFGALANGWGLPSFLANTQAPPIYHGSNVYYVNCCQAATITGCTTGSTTVVQCSGGIGQIQVGDMVAVSPMTGVTGGSGVWPVSATTSTSVTLLGSVTSGTWTSGGTIYAVRNGMGPGSDSSGTGSFTAPWATISKAQSAISTNGDATIYLNSGTYAESTGGNNRFIPNVLFSNWVDFTSFTGRPSDVTITNVGGTSGVINVRGNTFSRYQFSNLTVTPTGTVPCVQHNPSGAGTYNGLHFVNVVFAMPSSSSSSLVAILLGIQGSSVSVTSVAAGASNGLGGNLVQVNLSSTAGLSNGNTVTISGYTGTGASSINGVWTISNLVANTSFTLVGSTWTGASPTGTGTAIWQGTDFGLNDFACLNCTFQATGSATYGPVIFNALPATDTGTNQPFTNIGFWNCKTAATTATNSTAFSDFSYHATGLNGFTALGNSFTTGLNHAFLLGVDASALGGNGSLAVAQDSNVYVGGNFFDAGATASNGHACEIGENVQGAIVEYNTIIGTLHGVVIKGANGTVVRRNTVYNKRSSGLNGIYAKGSNATQFLANDVDTTFGVTFRAAYDSVTNIADSNTTLQGDWLVADGTSAALYWGPSPQSSGSGVADYNVYDLRSSATWGTLRAGTPASMATLLSGWTTYGLTGDIATNDGHSQINTAGATGTRNDTVYVGGSGNTGQTIYAEYVYQDGRRFNGLNLETYQVGFEARYAFVLFETPVSGTYSRPVPFNLPGGYWLVVERRQLGLLPAASDPIISTSALSFGS